METKFNTIIKNIEDNPDSSITSIRVWNVETSSYEDDKYYVDSDHPFYEDYSVL